MELDFTKEQQRFRDEVRAFLAENFTPELRAAAKRQAGVFSHPELGRIWHNILYKQGWIAPSWPVEYGGTGWSPVEKYIFAAECAKERTPVLPGMGIRLCGPVLIRYGTEAQKRELLPKMLSGEHYWCQGYSEPGVGSDLASLRTRAIREDDVYVVNGSKLWTTHAHFANWIFLLVRTSIEERKQAGISFMVVPLDTPGISITPILSMSGEHEVNQVFFDNVRIPVANLIGAEGQGWAIAKYLLEWERGGGNFSGELNAAAAELRMMAQQTPDGEGGTLSSSHAFQEKTARAEVLATAIDWTERRFALATGDDGRIGDFMASIKKIGGTEVSQLIADLKVQALGDYAAPDQCNALGMHPREDPVGPVYADTTTAKFLNGRAATIFGGSSEIQRSILAKSLGL